MANILDIFLEYGKKISDKTYFAPNLPEKKLNNAIKKSGYEGTPEEVLMLFDTSLFGSCKEGMLFTSKELIYKAGFMDPVRVTYKEIEDIQYEEIEHQKDNGKIIKKHKLTFSFNNKDNKVSFEDILFMNHKAFQELILKIIDTETNYSIDNLIFTINDMSDILKLSYVKVIVNYAYSNDGVIDTREYAEILSLVSRLDYNVSQRFLIREYMAYSEDELTSYLEDTKTLVETLLSECPSGNENAIKISLFKDLINIYMSTGKEDINDCDYIKDIRQYLDITDEQLKLVMQAYSNDRKILEDDTNDNQIAKGIKELLATSAAVGMPIAALYMSGSVVGLSAAGVTSGLATLGFGGVLGFSSMVTGVGVATLIGLGAYKGIKKFTGASEIENMKIKEQYLLEILKTNQKTINILIEDISFVWDQLQDFRKQAALGELKFEKLCQRNNQLFSAYRYESTKNEKLEIKLLRTKCPNIMDMNRLTTLTRDPTKQKYFAIVDNCYEMKERVKEDKQIIQYYVLKNTIAFEEISQLVEVLTAIGYFNIAQISKNTVNSLKDLAFSKISGY